MNRPPIPKLHANRTPIEIEVKSILVAIKTIRTIKNGQIGHQQPGELREIDLVRKLFKAAA